MTLGGLALAVGILVDDATVEVENINRAAEMDKDMDEVVLDSASQIATPAFVATLSICIVLCLSSTHCLFCGCAVGPNYHTPTVDTPSAYEEAADWKPAQPNDQNLGGDWWTIFKDPELDQLEQQVNVSNQNLIAAEAQYQQARAALRYNRADYYQAVTAGLSGGRERVSSHAPPPGSNFVGISYNDFVVPVDISYEADVWGRVRRTVESYREQAQASAADLATVNLWNIS